MPRLMLLRHAKSDWSRPGLRDADRPLNARGRSAAPRVGQLMKARGWQPDRVLCSPAQRARETLMLALAELAPVPDTHFLPSLYERLDEDYLDEIRRHAGAARALLVVGHNSATQTTASTLARDDGSERLKRMRQEFPTGALALFDAEGAWADLAAGAARLVDFVRPRDLDAPP
jgi:phosphohistidine phosphatase